MNSIVTGAMCEIQGRCLSGEQYDLLRKQAARIAELEATLDRLYRVGHCGSVDSFLACDDEVKRGYFSMMVEESTDNKKLRERVAELEAERDFLHHKAECLNMERKSQDRELAALRQRIDDAPVVAWLFNGETYPVKQCSIVTDEEFPDQVPLISKEDLK